MSTFGADKLCTLIQQRCQDLCSRVGVHKVLTIISQYFEMFTASQKFAIQSRLTYAHTFSMSGCEFNWWD